MPSSPPPLCRALWWPFAPITSAGSTLATRFFLPGVVLGRVFRGKFLDALKDAFPKGKLVFPGGLRAPGGRPSAAFLQTALP